MGTKKDLLHFVFKREESKKLPKKPIHHDKKSLALKQEMEQKEREEYEEMIRLHGHCTVCETNIRLE